jgi:nucleotide-binding universal stress UspA family protein
MIQLKNILLPTDFSDFSHVANRYACDFADQYHATLHVAHVLQLLPSTTPTFGGGLVWNDQNSLLPSEWTKSHEVRTVILAGNPYAEILRYAEDNSIDLIVMATHGHTGLTHMLMGSVAERVVRKSQCPVLTVRPDGHRV